MKEKIIVIDDHFEIPEEIKNMSEEELEKEIEKLEEEGRSILAVALGFVVLTIYEL